VNEAQHHCLALPYSASNKHGAGGRMGSTVVTILEFCSAAVVLHIVLACVQLWARNCCGCRLGGL
jgi:hypothetical protein